MTSNEAEYRALIARLAACKRLGLAAVTALSDRELMVRQLTGPYRVRNAKLAALVSEVREMVERDFAYVRFEHRRRDVPEAAECNRMADAVLTSAGYPRLPRPPRGERRAV